MLPYESQGKQHPPIRRGGFYIRPRAHTVRPYKAMAFLHAKLVPPVHTVRASHFKSLPL